ncbi:MAG: hypothetical protein KFF50_02835 [Desulfatitalea sp.]|nr:hypothetical protein [Desulfatitalea sp.]
MNPERFWILGAGRFGHLAVERITRHIPCAPLTMVDRDPSAGAAAGIRTITRDGIEWLCMPPCATYIRFYCYVAVRENLNAGWRSRRRPKPKSYRPSGTMWIPVGSYNPWPHKRPC